MMAQYYTQNSGIAKMCTTLSTTLAWVVPVKPDMLGIRLDAFIKALPQLKALRLCHRFGNGPNVHITKLPQEIELAIEELLVKPEPFWLSHEWDESDWDDDFRCFESRCEPKGHLGPDMNSPLEDSTDFDRCEVCDEDIYDGECERQCAIAGVSLCAECENGGKPTDCLNSCLVQWGIEVNHVAMEWEVSWLEDHWATLRRWRKLIDQRPNGNFVKYDKILRKHFGLEASFSTTRIATSETSIWPKDFNHRWHDPEDLQTTICYLTMPGCRAIEKRYLLTDFEAEGGVSGISAAQAMTITSPTNADVSILRPRFNRALKILGLKPHLHPSQKLSALSPAIDGEQKSKGPDSVNETDSPKAKAKKQAAAQTDWPHLLLLVKSDHDY